MSSMRKLGEWNLMLFLGRMQPQMQVAFAQQQPPRSQGSKWQVARAALIGGEHEVLRRLHEPGSCHVSDTWFVRCVSREHAKSAQYFLHAHVYFYAPG